MATILQTLLKMGRLTGNNSLLLHPLGWGKLVLLQYSSLYPWELLQSNGKRSVVFCGVGEEVEVRKKARKNSLKA